MKKSLFILIFIGILTLQEVNAANIVIDTKEYFPLTTTTWLYRF